MLNTQYVEQLAAQGRAQVMHLDMARRVCLVRLDPPAGGAPGWPRNVVALRAIPYAIAGRIPLTPKPTRRGAI